MKRYKFYVILVFNFLILSPNGFSQSTLPKQKADSLWKIWNNKKISDTIRLEALNNYLWDGYLNSQPDSALYFSKIQYDFAKSKGLKKQISFALSNQGSVAYLKSDYRKAIDLFSQSLRILREIGYDNGAASKLNNIGLAYAGLGEYSKAKEFYFESLKLAEKLKDKKSMANALNNIGNVYYFQSDYLNTINYYSRALKLREQVGDKIAISTSLNNIGATLRKQGNYAKALEYYMKSLKLSEETGNKVTQGFSLSNIGIIYQDRREYEKAIHYFERSLKIRKDLIDKNGEATTLTNLANTFFELGDFEKAKEYHFNCLDIQEKIGDKLGNASTLNNIGNVYKAKQEFDNALLYYYKSIDLAETLGNKNDIASTLNNIGNIYHYQGKLMKSLETNYKALNIAKDIGELNLIRNCARSLWQTNKKLGNFSESLKMHELFITAKDSLQNEEVDRAIIRQEFKYNYDKQLVLDSITNAKKIEIKNIELAKQKVEISVKRNQQFALLGVLFLVIIFSVFMYNRYKLTKSQKTIIETQKEEVESQKHLVEEKQKEILDSIHYAKRLQEAILPPLHFINEHAPNNFVLYQPKDVVAGDFYWSEIKDDKFFIAAADSTGHGVPGAMVSVVCSNALNRTINEFGITDTGKILDKTRELVLETFAKGNSEVKDGMDISLLCIDKSNNKVYWSGANNPLWYVKSSATSIAVEKWTDTGLDSARPDIQLIEIKADKQPIGKSEITKPFTVHEIALQDGMQFYLFTDGFADQFGGPRGKKFMYKQLENLLLSISNKAMHEQKELLEESFLQWKGDLEQVDDVCVIGVRV